MNALHAAMLAQLRADLDGPARAVCEHARAFRTAWDLGHKPVAKEAWQRLCCAARGLAVALGDALTGWPGLGFDLGDVIGGPALVVCTAAVAVHEHATVPAARELAADEYRARLDRLRRAALQHG